MFNMKGEVIGIVSSIVTESGGFEGIGFAAAVNTARELLLNQKAFWSGLDTILVTGPLARALNVPQDAGLLVQRVAGDSPGKKLGLRAGTMWITSGEQKLIIGGDIILSVEGIPVSTETEDLKRIQSIVVGQQENLGLSLRVLRRGEIIQLSMP